MSHATGAELTNAIRHRYRAVASRHHLAGVGPVHMESQAINARAYIAAPAGQMDSSHAIAQAGVL